MRHAPAVAVPERLDAVLLSHLHHDHLDIASLRLIEPSVPVVVPPAAARSRTLRRCGREIRPLAVGDTMPIGGAVVRAVPAVHPHSRWPSRATVDSAGFVVEGAGSIYFAGDTELFDGMRDIVADVALLPVWGWGRTAGDGHMDPDQAARAAALVRPAVAIPIHWGTFLPVGLRRRLGHLLRAPGPVFAERVAVHAPDVRVEVLRPGATARV